MGLSRSRKPVSYTHLDVYKRQAQQSGWIQPSHSEAAFAKAKDRVRQWAAMARPVALLSRAEVTRLTGVEGWLGGWIDRSGGVLNPVGFARGPVSYTHLDVYKRQVNGAACDLYGIGTGGDFRHQAAHRL